MITRKLFVLATLGLLACASSKAVVPADKLTRAQAAVRGAEVVGAEQDPNAATHLRFAREQLDLGKRMIEEGSNQRAELILERAEADAQASMNLARASNAKLEATQTIERVQKAKMSIPQEGTP